MPASITLTVSHLPTSTSFFLSALQPLNYAYRGRSGQTIGFGPTDSPAPADFWLTQEIPGVPAGAAHVAFPASSHVAVQGFFSAALRAGGKIHGEPCVRDASGYYSAAVIDFDGNSIEAVYRPVPSSPDSNKENMSIISKSQLSKAPTTISRAPSSASKARSVAVSRAPSQPASKAPSLAPSRQPSPPKSGDALDRILNSARDTADVARNLVEQVRPNLNSTKSFPAAGMQQSQSHEPSDAIVGTLLGVAAGAALHYAFANRKSSPESDRERDRGRDRRPSITGRSMTAPAPQYDYASEAGRGSDGKSLYSRGGGKYITLEDNDYASTVRGPAGGSAAPSRRSRRGSIDSGIGISPPSSTSRASGKKGASGVKMLEAPPSAYKAPTVITAVTRQSGGGGRRSSSVGRDKVASQHGGRSGGGGRRSSSASRDRDAQTVLHIREFRRVESFPAEQREGGSQASTVKPSGKQSSASKSRRTSPEKIPLPPSRAATWADGRGGSEASFATAKSGGAKTIMGLEKVQSEASQKNRDMTKSVVGKLRDIKRLDVESGEVSPQDSVSQVSSSRGSRKSRH